MKEDKKQIEDEDTDNEDEGLFDYVPVPPDGGWGWMVVLASFMANLVVDGISYSFGIFLTEFQGYYSSTQGLTAMVGSLLTGCYLVVGPVVGGLVNRFGSRAIMMVGAFIGMGAFFVSVWAPTLTILMISYGILGGFYVPFVYLNNRAEEYGVTAGNASFLLSIIGITNTLGRVVFGWVSDHGWVSALTINNGCLVSCGLLTMLCPFFTSYATMAAYSAVFGFLISAYISLTSIILVDYLGLDRLTNSFGLLILSRGLSAMAGSPLAGGVYDATKSYNHSFYFAGGLILAAGVVSCGIPIAYRMQESCVNFWSKSPSPKILSAGPNNHIVMSDRPTDHSQQLYNDDNRLEITAV